MNRQKTLRLKIGLTAFIIGLSLLSFGIFAREKQKFEAHPLLKAKLEQNFKSLRIVNLKADGSPNVLYIRDGELVLGDKRLPLPENFYGIRYAPSNQFFATLALIPLSKTRLPEKELRIQVYTQEMSPLYQVRQKLASHEPIPLTVVTDNGQLILGKSEIGRLLFYSSAGELMQTVDLFPEAAYDLERILIVKPAEQSGSVAVLATMRGSAPMESEAQNPSGEPHLFLFDSSGKEKWRVPIAQTTAQNLAISPDGKYLVASGYSVLREQQLVKKTILFKKDGTSFKEFSFLFHQAHFTPQTQRLLLANHSTVRQIDLKTGTLLWEKSFNPKQGMITAIAQDSTTAMVLMAQNRFENKQFIFKNPALILFDLDGNQLQELPFTNDVFLKPLLQIFDQQIYLGFSRNLYQIEVQK